MLTIRPPRSLLLEGCARAKNRPPRPIVSKVLPVETLLVGDDFANDDDDIASQARELELEVARGHAAELTPDPEEAAARLEEERARIEAARAAQAMIDAAAGPPAAAAAPLDLEPAPSAAEPVPLDPAAPAAAAPTAPPPAATDHRSRRALKRLKVAQLRNLCKKHGMGADGTKDVLVERLATTD